jgi:hypothetical protein
MTVTLRIGTGECETLHRLLVRRFNAFSEWSCKLAEAEGVSFEQLIESSGDDLRLFDEVGLEFLGVAGDPKGAELTMPADRLAATIRRLREDARRALFEEADGREPAETAKERRERFLLARRTCDQLLDDLDAVREVGSP